MYTCLLISENYFRVWKPLLRNMLGLNRLADLSAWFRSKPNQRSALLLSQAVLPRSFMTFHMAEFVIRKGSKKAVVSQILRHSRFEQWHCSIFIVSQQLPYQIWTVGTWSLPDPPQQALQLFKVTEFNLLFLFCLLPIICNIAKRVKSISFLCTTVLSVWYFLSDIWEISWTILRWIFIFVQIWIGTLS